MAHLVGLESQKCLPTPLFVQLFWSNHSNTCFHTVYNSYPPPGKRLKTKEILIHPTHLLPYPKFGWRPKSDQKWVFTNFGPAIYSCKADGKKISKSQKEIDLPHPLPSPSKIWSWALKLLQKKVHYVWLCHKPLESPWKGDFKRRKIL